MSCDEPPARSGAVYENILWIFESEQKMGVTPLEKGLSPQRLGFKTIGFQRNP